jgi:hypothetical protein
MADEWDAEVARKSLHDHELPPAGFNFATASDRDRVRYGFPPEPDRQTQPQLWAKWERNLSRPWRRVVPEYELQPARFIRHGLPVANANSSNWSGAVATPPAGDTFDTVSATWIVPDAYPPPSDQNGSGRYNDGYFNALHWVGIDGDGGAGANNVLQAGTGTDVQVVNGAITVSCYLWYEWYYSVTNNGFVKLTSFTVSPGDLIEVLVCGFSGSDAGINIGRATIGNVTRNEYMTQYIDAPSSTLRLAGSTAEWILEREGLLSSGTFAKLADYGAIFFSDCLAGHTNSDGTKFEVNLASAGLVNMTDGSATVSTALGVSNSVLECYYGTTQP